MQRLTLFNEFWNVANEEKFTMLAVSYSRLLQHAHWKVSPCVNTTMVNRQLVRIASSYGVIAIGRLHYNATINAEYINHD